MISEKYRLTAGIGIILVAGFTLTTISAYVSARDVMRQQIERQILPMAADQALAELRRALAGPVTSSSLLAQDAAVREWLAGDLGDHERLGLYLKEAGRQHGAPVFLVSDRTRQIYRPDGAPKSLEEGPSGKWLDRLRENGAPQVRLSRDDPDGHVHHPILARDGGFLGATGVAVDKQALAALLDQFRANRQTTIYLVDDAGGIVLSGKSMGQAGTIHGRAGIRNTAGALLRTDASPRTLEFQDGDKAGMVQARSVPELGLRLIAERPLASGLETLQSVLQLNLVIAAALILLSLAVIQRSIERHRRQFERAASLDPLTGLLNRQAFSILLEQTMRDVDRNGRPLSIILFDIDMFRQINDRHGIESGDDVLRAVAELARRGVRDNDIVARWGNEEFLVLLRDCELEVAARLADNLREQIATLDFGLPEDVRVTASVGVAQYLLEESEERLFERADKARLSAKQAGRNRTIVSVMEGQDAQPPPGKTPPAPATDTQSVVA
jgi:diguanylate cyclase (GGDEF)-like protein